MVMVNFGLRDELAQLDQRRLARLAVDHGEQAVVKNLDHLLAHARAAVAERGHDAAPVRVAAGPRGLDQFRLGHGQRRELRVLRAGRALDHDIDHAGDPLAVLDDHPRELAHDMGERLLEQVELRMIALEQVRAREAVGQDDDGVVGRGVAIDRNAVEGMLDRLVDAGLQRRPCRCSRRW